MDSKIYDIAVIGGGIIPTEDISRLKEAGLREVFLPGVALQEVVQWVTENIKPSETPDLNAKQNK